MKVWLTCFADAYESVVCKPHIVEMDAVISEAVSCHGVVAFSEIDGEARTAVFLEKDVHFSLESALRQVEHLRHEKIVELLKQIEYLATLEFPVRTAKEGAK